MAPHSRGSITPTLKVLGVTLLVVKIGKIGLVIIYDDHYDSYMATCYTTTCFFFGIRPPEESPHQTCRTFRGESDSSTPEAPGGLSVAVVEAFRRTPKPAAWTIETSPDKKMEVGGLQSPREYDGRLPLDVGYYLDLVIPRKEEPWKKTRACFE